MRCPFCAAEKDDNALVCQTCNRDTAVPHSLRAELTADNEEKVFNAISATSFLVVRNAGVPGAQVDQPNPALAEEKKDAPLLIRNTSSCLKAKMTAPCALQRSSSPSVSPASRSSGAKR